MANKVTPVDYDFTTIKTSLKTYLQNQTEFADYKFEGSAMSTFLDVLAYNTHYNALTVNFGLNESFLDSAKIRSSVVSSAKSLGYTPKSNTSAVATVDVQVNGPNIPAGTGALSMPAGSKFTTAIEDFGPDLKPFMPKGLENKVYDNNIHTVFLCSTNFNSFFNSVFLIDSFCSWAFFSK